MKELHLRAAVLWVALALTMHGISTAGALANNTSKRNIYGVTSTQLLEMMVYEDTRLVDVRDRGAFVAGHIRGAVHLPPTLASGNRGNRPGDATAAEVLRIAGITTSTNVVIYDSLSGHQARLVAETLRLAGYKNVSLLAGGLSGWMRGGGSVVKGTGSSWSPSLQNAP